MTDIKDREILLVNLPPGKDYRYENAGSLYPATGIMVIGTILKKNGYNVTLVDGALDRCYEDRVVEKVSEKTLFVGFSTMTSQLIMAYDLAVRIKNKNPDTAVLFGGIHPTLYPEQTVENPYVDIVLVNEGARTILEIMDYFKGATELKDINGIVYKTEEGKATATSPRDLDGVDDVPHFDFDLLDIEKYLGRKSVYARELDPENKKTLRVMPILSGLGCCFKCAFCINVILKRKYRLRSAESIVSEMKRLKVRYGANAFLFLDEDFCINRERLKEFLDETEKAGIEFAGRIWTRVSYFRNDEFKSLIPRMEKVGIRSIAMGAESGSQKILDNIKKGIKKEDIGLAARELSSYDITPRFSFITGMEGETRDDTVATFKLCGDLLKINRRTDIAGPFVFRYYPGSPIFEQMVEKYGIEIPGAVDEWRKAINDDGSLKIDSEKWTWSGFNRYSGSMHDYLTVYSYILNRPSMRKRPIVKYLKKVILWRVSIGEHMYWIDYGVISVLKGVRRLHLRYIARRGREKESGYDDSRHNTVKDGVDTFAG